MQELTRTRPRELWLVMLIGALVASLMLLTFNVGAAHAIGASADFYYSTSCSVDPAGKARMSVTNWDIPSGQRYHIDLSSYIGVGTDYYQKAIYINGVLLSGGTDDRYWDDSGRYDSNTFKGVWTTSAGFTVSCSRTL